VLVGANLGRLALVAGVATLLAVGAGDLPVLCRAPRGHQPRRRRGESASNR
jgi:hypothetical protein